MKRLSKIITLFKRRKRHRLIICCNLNTFSHIVLESFHTKDIRYVKDINYCRGYSRKSPILVYGLPYLPKEKLELIEELSVRGYSFQMIREDM